MNRYNSTALAMAFTFLAVGCGSGQDTVAEQPVADIGTPEIASRPLAAAEIVAADIALDIDYAFARQPASGEPLTVTFTISAAGVTDGYVTMRTEGKISLSDNMPERIELSTLSGEDRTQRVDAVVNVEGEGRSVLKVQVVGRQNDQRVTAVAAVPIYSGASGQVVKVDGQTIDDGVEVLSSLPAPDS